MSLTAVHRAFLDWFGAEYDLAAINAVLATAAAQRLDGDPLWLLLISGSGNAKTETVSALAGSGALVTSTITSEGALLSGSPKREQAKDASGGLLQRIGKSGVLIIKDVTSILSADRNSRSGVLAAFREIHDGRWERNVGTDGGRTLTWTGRIAVIGACTTAWDRAHDVIASMGDRFVVVRIDSNIGRMSAGYKAMANVGAETRMREALSVVVAEALSRIDARGAISLHPDETDQILAAANVVTLCRTGVDFDYRGDVIDAHQPEAPTRFAKQLVQMMRGACALGIARTDALHLALRCARDSMPPLRLAILEDVAANPRAKTREVRQRINKPKSTVDRQLQALHMLDVLDCEEVEIGERSSWYYSVRPEIDVSAIAVPDLLLPTKWKNKEVEAPTHISGTSRSTLEPVARFVG
ncbi:MAG TPA: hypothetical protein VM032_16825 [Vicinamibacterales bacterium]|nr:hypothetical protein [Vicinamibacterales bacterium]